MLKQTTMTLWSGSSSISVGVSGPGHQWVTMTVDDLLALITGQRHGPAQRISQNDQAARGDLAEQVANQLRNSIAPSSRAANSFLTNRGRCVRRVNRSSPGCISPGGPATRKSWSRSAAADAVVGDLFADDSRAWMSSMPVSGFPTRKIVGANSGKY